MAFFGLYTSKQEKQEIEKQQQELLKNLKDKQDELGRELFSTLKIAASQNKVYKTFKDGTTSNNIGELKIIPMPANGNNYSLLVRIENFEIGGPRFYDIWQIDVNTNKDELHVLKCPYGPESYVPLSSFEAKKEELSDLVKTYRLFN